MTIIPLTIRKQERMTPAQSGLLHDACVLLDALEQATAVLKKGGCPPGISQRAWARVLRGLEDVIRDYHEALQTYRARFNEEPPNEKAK